MFRKLAALTVLALATAAPASAQVLTRVPDWEGGGHAYMADDSNGTNHYIQVIRKDRDGDFLVEVTLQDTSRPIGQMYLSDARFWVSCSRDEIVLAEQGASWQAVNHNKMEGHYYDAACRPSVAMSLAEQYAL